MEETNEYQGMTDEGLIQLYKKYEKEVKEITETKDKLKKEIERRLEDTFILENDLYEVTITEFKTKRIDSDKVKKLLEQNNLEIPYKETESSRLKWQFKPTKNE